MDMLLGLVIGVWIGWLIRRIQLSTASPQAVAAIVEVPPMHFGQAEAERRVRKMQRKLLKASSALYTRS